MGGMVRKLIWISLALVLTASLWMTSALAETVCQLGDKGTEVRVLQTRLNTLGYLASEPVSPYTFDAKTKTAVKKFQAATGIAESEAAATGIVDDVTYIRVKLSTAVTYEQYKDKLHAKGGAGEEVLETKTRLKRLGYLTGTLSNQYDQATVTAVSCFQRANGLNDSGIADRATRDVIFSANAVTMKEYQKIANLTVVKKGDSGEQVAVVQQQLSGLGYYSGSISGTYSATVVTSVKLFQTANGLRANGIADVTTREVLNSGKGKDFDAYTAEQKLVTVEKGSTGYPVQLLQSRLKELYYYAGKISGKCDAATVGAIKAFQSGNNLSANGVASTQTREAMNADGALTRLQTVGLIPGDNLSEVTDMTTLLKKLGYISGITSKYSDQVTTAVKAFQKANGLTVTGKASPETLEAMGKSDAVTYDEYRNGSGNQKIETMIKIAYKYIGNPYKSNCDVPNSFDCSRYTKFVFGKVGISLSGEVETQGRSAASKWGAIKDISGLKRGDLLFFDTQPEKKSIGHSAIYLGKNSKGVPQFIHASSAAGKVVVSDFSDWYRERFVYGARPIK